MPAGGPSNFPFRALPLARDPLAGVASPCAASASTFFFRAESPRRTRSSRHRARTAFGSIGFVSALVFMALKFARKSYVNASQFS